MRKEARTHSVRASLVIRSTPDAPRLSFIGSCTVNTPRAGYWHPDSHTENLPRRHIRPYWNNPSSSP